jgi:hypothetical protein
MTGVTNTVSIFSNEISENSGTKGIIFIEKAKTIEKAILIKDNEFTWNTGFEFSSVIYIRYIADTTMVSSTEITGYFYTESDWDLDAGDANYPSTT